MKIQETKQLKSSVRIRDNVCFQALWMMTGNWRVFFNAYLLFAFFYFWSWLKKKWTFFLKESHPLKQAFDHDLASCHLPSEVHSDSSLPSSLTNLGVFKGLKGEILLEKNAKKRWKKVKKRWKKCKKKREKKKKRKQ
jgi:hypothetical protein